MGWLSKAVKYATGGLVDRDAKKKAEKKAKEQQAALEKQAHQEELQADQNENMNRQNDADAAAIQEGGGEDGGGTVLTDVEGLVAGDRKLNKKKALGA